MNKMEKLLTIQSKLFEKAHSESMELKPLGFKVKNEGINLNKYYCNPDFLLLPLKHCDVLSQLNPQQISVLTALYFATTYAEIASSETIALKYNLVAAEKVFNIYSDQYMILFNETAEETDHIITFQNLCNGLLSSPQALGPSNYNHLKPVYDAFSNFEPMLCNYGFSSMYLLMRYLLNLALKQLESFMTKGLHEEKIHKTTQAIIKGHAVDEARHTTTSLQLGMEFYYKASKNSKSFIRSLLKRSIYSMVDMRFSNLHDHYQHTVAKRVLNLALKHTAFAGINLTVAELEKRWGSQGAIISASPEYISSQRWIAQQINRLVEMLEIKVSTHNPNVEKYISLLKAA